MLKGFWFPRKSLICSFQYTDVSDVHGQLLFDRMVKWVYVVYACTHTHAQFRHCSITEPKIVYNVTNTLLFSILWTLSPVGTKKKYQSENSYVKG